MSTKLAMCAFCCVLMMALATSSGCSCASGESEDSGQGAASNASGSLGGNLGIGGQGGGGLGTCATASDEVVASPVDVIFAIDQSASMGEEIQGVIDNLNTNLVTILAAAKIDYRVIFVTGAKGLPSGPAYFQAAANVNSSDALTLLLWTYDGMNKLPNTCDQVSAPEVGYSDFLRYDSQKVFIAVSDDDPSSFDCAKATAGCTSNCSGCNNNCAGYCPMHQCPTYADKAAAWGGADFPTELYALEPAGMFGKVGRPSNGPTTTRPSCCAVRPATSSSRAPTPRSA